jgi:hypothetical protein
MIMKMSWLWFLLALYLDCLIVYPAVYWTQRRHAKKPLDGVDVQLIIAQMSIFICYAYVNLNLLGKETMQW